MDRTDNPPCDHSWNVWVSADLLQPFYCDKPANGWGREMKVKGRWGNYCKTHQTDSKTAVLFLVDIRELQYRWLTTGYLSNKATEPVDPWEACPMCGGTGWVSLDRSKCR